MKTGPQPSYRLMEAACKGADPSLFDFFDGERVEDALSYCDRCTVIEECLAYVSPRRSYFDGVAAGKVWRNGRPYVPGLFEGDE
jgi:WhiB family redox-sensing transcriptional regulator